MTDRTDEEPGKITVDEDAYLPADEVAGNFRDYLDALDDEMGMAEQLVAALESGRLESTELVDAMPDPSPMEAWNASNYRDLRDGGETFEVDIPEGGDDGGE